MSFSDFKKKIEKKTENFDEKNFREKNLRKKFKMENQRKKLESRKFFEKKLGNREPSREKNRKILYEQIKKNQQEKFSINFSC